MDAPNEFSISEEFIACMRRKEKQLDEDINNSLAFNKRHAYLLGRGHQYDDTCPCRKKNYDIEPNNAIHIIISNNIYSVWFESQNVAKNKCNFDLLDDFMGFYKTQTENIGTFGCFRPKRVYHGSSLETIIDRYMLQFQMEREDGFYAIKKSISVL
jgi:hypothetical protein